MKSLKKYILGIAVVTMGAGMTSCQDDCDDNTPGLNIPIATMEPNATILEVKKAYWQNTVNYIDEGIVDLLHKLRCRRVGHAI